MVEKQGQKIRAGVSPPLFRQCPKENIFFCRSPFITDYEFNSVNITKTKINLHMI